MMTTFGCAHNNNNRINVPGNPTAYSYGITFDLDWDVYDSGTFSYGPEGSTVRRMGGGRTGYELFFDLTLNFKLKDGREYHEKIDVRPLIEKMLEKYELPDLNKSKWGGMTDLRIIVQSNKLSLVYYIYENRKTENGQQELFPKRYNFPVFEKRLD